MKLFLFSASIPFFFVFLFKHISFYDVLWWVPHWFRHESSIGIDLNGPMRCHWKNQDQEMREQRSWLLWDVVHGWRPCSSNGAGMNQLKCWWYYRCHCRRRRHPLPSCYSMMSQSVVAFLIFLSFFLPSSTVIQLVQTLLFIIVSYD